MAQYVAVKRRMENAYPGMPARRELTSRLSLLVASHREASRKPLHDISRASLTANVCTPVTAPATIGLSCSPERTRVSLLG